MPLSLSLSRVAVNGVCEYEFRVCVYCLCLTRTRGASVPPVLMPSLFVSGAERSGAVSESQTSRGRHQTARDVSHGDVRLDFEWNAASEPNIALLIIMTRQM